MKFIELISAVSTNLRNFANVTPNGHDGLAIWSAGPISREARPAANAGLVCLLTSGVGINPKLYQMKLRGARDAALSICTAELLDTNDMIL